MNTESKDCDEWLVLYQQMLDRAIRERNAAIKALKIAEVTRCELQEQLATVLQELHAIRRGEGE